MMDHGVIVSNLEGVIWLDVKIPPAKSHGMLLTKYLKENGPVPVPTFIILKNVPNEMIILSD